MAQRRIKLPGIQDLSKEQEDARALPLEGQHLIIGGPGTGKSVLALLRAKRLRSENAAYVFLVYNHLLSQSSRQLFGGELVSAQWQSWFLNCFQEFAGEPMPRFPAKPHSRWKAFNWDAGLEIAANTETSGSADRPYLVIDEGQDMPPGFYQCLANFGFANFFVVADQNQQIAPGENSSRRDIENALAVMPSEVIELKMNYRNKYPTARLAQSFYTGDPASPPPDLPPASSSQANVPLLYAYPPPAFSAIIGRIAKMADRMPAKLIGIITPDNNVREVYFLALDKTHPGLENGNINVSTFKSGDTHELAFDEGGIMVINAQSCKGLEFDVVFIAGLHEFKVKHPFVDQAKRLFYVMVARAIDRVIMLQELGRHCSADAILPADTKVLERY